MASAMSQRFDQVVRTMIDAHTTSVEAHRRIAEYARGRLQDLIRSGEGSPDYTRIVDGVIGAPEEAVKLDGGRIEYLFARSTEAVVFALQFAREISPDPGGEYSRNWVIAVDGQPWTGALTDIPAKETVTLFNFSDYARILEERHRPGKSGVLRPRPSKRPRMASRSLWANARFRPENVITELVRRAVSRRFPTVDVERIFVTVPGAYILKRGRFRGEPITYPAVRLTPKKA
jgi:hypothetical protein